MKIDFDPEKDASNLAKHGVSLALAAELDWEAALVWVDDRFEYGESRLIALAHVPEFSTTWRLWIEGAPVESSACVAPTVAR